MSIAASYRREYTDSSFKMQSYDFFSAMRCGCYGCSKAIKSLFSPLCEKVYFYHSLIWFFLLWEQNLNNIGKSENTFPNHMA